MLSISRGDNCGLLGLMKFPCGCIACGILGILQLRCIDFSPWSGKMASFVASLCSRTSSEMYLDGPRQTQYDSVIQQPITFLSGQIPSSLGIQDVLNGGLALSHPSVFVKPLDADLEFKRGWLTWHLVPQRQEIQFQNVSKMPDVVIHTTTFHFNLASWNYNELHVLSKFCRYDAQQSALPSSTNAI